MSSPTEQYAQSIADAIERIQRCTDEAINKPLLPASVVQVLDSNEFQRDRKLTAGQVGNYLQHRGCHCPNCLSHDIQGGSVEIDEGIATQTVSCGACECEWTDVYQLCTVRNVSFASGKEGTVSTDPSQS